MEVQTTGIESEAWVGRREGGVLKPVDVTPFIEEHRRLNGHRPHGNITREPGLGSLEYAAREGDTVSAAVAHVRGLHEWMSERVDDIIFDVRSPYAHLEREPEVKKPRYKALWASARRELEMLGLEEKEIEKRLSRMGNLNTHAATHAHLGFGNDAVTAEYIDSKVIFLINVLNHVGPRIARIYCRASGLNNTGHLGITWGWANPNRFCRSNIWFKDFEDFRHQFGSLKRMMRPVGELDTEFGDWEVDLRSNMEWGNPADYKTGYWPHVRPRCEFGTVEVRLLPSWPIETLQCPIQGIVDFTNFLLDIAPKTPFKTLGQLKESPVWEKITTRPFFGVKIPQNYNGQMWHNDVFN